VSGLHAAGAGRGEAGARGHECGARAGRASFRPWAETKVRSAFFPFSFLFSKIKKSTKVTILSNIKVFSRLGPKIKVIDFEEKNISY
jgi:hypothetical protein